MADCKQCLHYEVCADMAEKFIDAFNRGAELSVVCKNFKDRTKWITRTSGNWIAGADGSYMCPVCNRVFRYEIGYFCSYCGAELKIE